MSPPTSLPEKQKANDNKPLAIKLTNDSNTMCISSIKPIQSTDQLKTFMSFLCDRNSLDISVTVRSSIGLFNYCIPARKAILTFYSELFTEYSAYYWLLKRKSISSSNIETNKSKIEYSGKLTKRFYEMAKLKMADAREDQQPDYGTIVAVPVRTRTSPTTSSSSLAGPASPTASQSCQSPSTEPKVIPIGPKVIPVSRRTSSCASDEVEQTPMSPPVQESRASPEDNVQYETDNIVVDIFPELECLIAEIKSAIEKLYSKAHSSKPNEESKRSHTKLRQSLNSWASELLIQLNTRHSEVAIQVATDMSKNDPSKLLSNQIELWLGNPVNKLLVDLLLESHSDIHALFKRLLDSNQYSDWLLAHILLEISKKPNHVKEFSSFKKAREIFYRMSLIYGNSFASKVICHYLNLPQNTFWSRLKPLLFKFMKHFGDDGSTLVSQTLSLDSELRTSNYWSNIYNLTQLLPELKLDLDIISQLLTDKLCATTFDAVSVAQLIKLCCNSLERVQHNKICIGTKHRLCMSLATCFFLLLEYESENFPEILSYIRISLTCMSLLKQSSIASHILCRALLERCLLYGHLFNENFNPDLVGGSDDFYDWNQDDSIKLSKENLKVTLGHRFRRLPNYTPDVRTSKKKLQSNNSTENGKPHKQSINCYLIIEAFKSSISDIDAFALLFVDFHCPVMFDKHSWPSDEALRVINERNLSILRKFEQIPPLWDLYELIGQAGCLKNCLVLVKALLAAHLALWASATTDSSTDKMISTSRLIPPLAQSNLVPKAFGLTVEVFPHLEPNEVFSVLSDIWHYLKDTNTNGLSGADISASDRKIKAKTYLNRLRLFMCQHIPGPLYVKIFKDFYTPVSS